MRKTIGYVAAMMLVCSTISAREKVLPEPRQVVAFTDVDSALIKELISGEHPDIVVEFAEGTEIPLYAFYNFGIFSAKHNPNFTVKAEQSCYLRFCKKKVYLSLDLTTWEKPERFFRGRWMADLKKKDLTSLLVEATLTPYSYEDDWDVED